MRTLTLLAALAASSPAIAAGPRIAAEEAPQHRGELVTLVGPVAEVQQRDDGVVLMVGTTTRVAVIVPAPAVGRLPKSPAEMREQSIEVTGFLTATQPLSLVVEEPESLVLGTTPTSDNPQVLQERVRKLQAELARERARTDAPALQLKTYGPTRSTQPVSPNAMEEAVLAERGVPDRVEWGPRGRVLVYGTTRYIFDAQGQLIESRTDR